MKTVGEILTKARQEKSITLEDIEKKIKIRKKFLVALESNSWNDLPSLTYIKGFLRAYSSFLGLSPEEMVAIFRRQFRYQEKTTLLPEGVTHAMDEAPFHVTPQLTIAVITITFLLLFFSYLFFQYRSIINPPNLTIAKPLEGEVLYEETVQIAGKTDPDAVISINNQKVVLSENGEFSYKLSLPPGVSTIQIESTSKYGKKSTMTRTIQIQTK